MCVCGGQGEWGWGVAYDKLKLLETHPAVYLIAMFIQSRAVLIYCFPDWFSWAVHCHLFALKCSWLDIGLFLKGSESIGRHFSGVDFFFFFKALEHIFSGIFPQVDKFARCSNMFESSRQMNKWLWR